MCLYTSIVYYGVVVIGGAVVDLTPDLLRDLYVGQLLSEKEIADRFGLYQVKVNRLRRQWGIPTIGKTERIAHRLPSLTPLQRDLVVGSLLGDGYMASSHPTTASFHISHSDKQEAYLRWKGDLLGPYVSSYTRTSKENLTGWRLTGVTTTHMREFYDLFYPAPECKRVFPASLPKILTPFSLAIWYMDDGSLNQTYHPRITFGLDALSLKRALKALRALGLKPKISGESIIFPDQDRLFFDLIAHHVPDCMAYKLPPVDSPRRKIDQNARQLTDALARSLYVGEQKSLEEIAALYGVSRSTVRRRLAGVPLRGSPLPKDIVERLRLYEPEQWGALPNADQDRWVEEAASLLRDFGFPYPPMLSEEEFQRDVQRVRDTSYRVEDDTLLPWTVSGNRACLPFFPNRYRAVSRGKHSAYDAWHDDQVLRWAVRFQLQEGDPVLPHRVLRAVTMQYRTPSVFRPTVARWVYETYCPTGGVVWDPCSGYGGRLMGACVAGVRYIGTDVEPETVEGNCRLAERLGYTAYDEILSPAERFDPGDVDLVFTSPPYFDREQYSNRGDQSWVSHGSDFEGWLEGFLRPVIATAFRRLASGRWMVLNVADIRKGRKVVPLVDRVTQVALEEGFRLHGVVWMPLARLNRAPEKAREPMLVFQRS